MRLVPFGTSSTQFVYFCFPMVSLKSSKALSREQRLKPSFNASANTDFAVGVLTKNIFIVEFFRVNNGENKISV
jgi:hypothetical protein